MRVRSMSAVVLALALAGAACARNRTDEEVGAARDTTAAARADTVQNQTQSGATDSTGQSTLGEGVERTRPDQGQPVTVKGDTINTGVDSSSNRGVDTSSAPR